MNNGHHHHNGFPTSLNNTQHPDPADPTNTPDPADHERAAAELTDAFTPHDLLALNTLNRDELIAQYEARQTLLDYLDALWNNTKNHTHNHTHTDADPDTRPGTDPGFTAITALRDLIQELLTNTENTGGAH